jgi:dipeptidyl aminopeptidase/acylaminoacyl peptidase
MHCLRLLAAIVLTSVSIAPLSGQMQVFARHKGEPLPVAGYRLNSWHVQKDGDTLSLHSRIIDEYTIRAGIGFGDGFVQVSGIEADTDPLRNATPKERTAPSAIRFRYRAQIVSDRPLSYGYALLTFTTGGSVGTHLLPIGSLSAGSTKELELEITSAVESIGTLHIFSEGRELRSTHHPDAYDVNEYYASLTKNSQVLSAAELLKWEQSFQNTLSFDGRLLATQRERDGKHRLLIYDLQTMSLLHDIPVVSADSWFGYLTWISNTELAYVAQDRPETDSPGAVNEHYLHLFDTATGKAARLLDEVYAIITPVLDTPHVLVVKGGRYGHIFFKYDVRTRKSFDLQEPDSGGYYFDRQGNARLRVRYEGDKIVYDFRPRPDDRWRSLDDSVKTPGLHFDLPAAKLLDRVADIHSVGPDGDTLYVSTRLGTDRFELAAYSMSEGVIKQTIAKHPRYDLTVTDGGATRLLFAKSSPQLLGIVFETQKIQVVWLDPRYAATQKAIDAALPGRTNLPLDWSMDGSTFIYFSSSDRDPGAIYVFRPQESRLIVIYKASEHTDDRRMSPTTPIEFTARDGQKIPAYVTRPKDAGSSPTPLVVSIHGGPTLRDSWRFDSFNQFFASRGYTVLQVNYRGSSGYGAAFQSAGLRNRIDTVVIDDIADGVRHLIARGEVDPARVVVTGGSFGGWATYTSLIRYPDLYRAGIAIAAVSDWRTSLKDSKQRFDNKFGHVFWKSLLARESFAEDEPFISPLKRAAEIKQPVFIVHGENDTVVHAGEARLMLNALKKHNAFVEARSFPHATHTYWSFDDRVALFNASALFIEKHLGKPDAPATPPAITAAP